MVNMYRFFAAFFVLCLMACGSAPSPAAAPEAPPSTPQASSSSAFDIEATRDSTIILVREVENNDGDKFYLMYCAGVWISPTKIITADHCVRAGVKMQYTIEEWIDIDGDPKYVGATLNYRTHADYQRDHQSPISQRARALKVIGVEKATDLALLEVSGNPPPHSIAKLHSGTMADGSFVWALGHSSGMHFTVSHGVVSASRRERDLTLLQVSVASSSGNSGGGVYGLDGSLLGIVSGGIEDAALVTLATHRDSIKDFVDANGGWQ